MAIKDVARIQKLPLSGKQPPGEAGSRKPGMSFPKAYKESPELLAEKESPDPLVPDTMRYAESSKGPVRQTGVHACGVIIGQDDLELFAPIAIAKDAELNVVQYEGKLVESVGLIKMDFLGLKTLSIIKDALENINRRPGGSSISTRSRWTTALRTGVQPRRDDRPVQFESPGMKKHLRNLKPNRFEDLIAMNALYRQARWSTSRTSSPASTGWNR